MIASETDLRKVRPIAENLNDAKRLLPYILEAEMLDVIDSIGAKIYKAIDENTVNTLTYTTGTTTVTYDDSEYSILMNGGYYDEEEKRCGGLINAIIYLAYGRFVKNNSLNVTAFGVVVKNGQLSEPADTKAVMIHSEESRKIGLEYLRQVYDYIVFKNGKVCGTKQTNGLRFKVIGD